MVQSDNPFSLHSSTLTGKILKFRYRGHQHGSSNNSSTKSLPYKVDDVDSSNNNCNDDNNNNNNNDISYPNRNHIHHLSGSRPAQSLSSSLTSSSTDMDTIQNHLALLLDAKPYEEMFEFCDFSLADQNEAALAKGVQPAASSEYKPVIQKSITYIVAAVLVNDRGEVLMMQVRIKIGLLPTVRFESKVRFNAYMELKESQLETRISHLSRILERESISHRHVTYAANRRRFSAINLWNCPSTYQKASLTNQGLWLEFSLPRPLLRG